MIIPKITFPIYGIIIVLSVFIGMLYIYIKLKKEIKKDKKILMFYIIYIAFSFVFGKLYTEIIYNISFLKAGLSAYGGLIGVIVGAIVFEKMLPQKNKLIKYSIISLPLVYGLTKIACFICGCCSGIPYNGIFKVIYSNGLNIGQMPIQLLETIVFISIFIFCNHFSEEKNIEYKTLILVFVFKFLLDFLRYDHVTCILSKNQIFSLVAIIFVFISVLISKRNINKTIKNGVKKYADNEKRIKYMDADNILTDKEGNLNIDYTKRGCI